MDTRLINSTLAHKVLAASTPNKNRHPALILLHGRGADENDLLDLAQSLDPRFFIISARAPFHYPYGGYTWYPLAETSLPAAAEFEESHCRLVQFVEDIKAHYPVDAGSIFLLGFSMGSVMSFAVSLTKPVLVSGVVAHSGYIPENTSLQFQWESLADLSFFVAHGINDPVISIEHGRRAKELLAKSKAQLTYREYPIGHTMSEESLSDLSAWLQDRLDLAAEQK